MQDAGVWALVLAAGDGTRLSSLTTLSCGVRVPKQFCSLRGGASLLEDAMARAGAVTTRARVLAVVADQHRRWWQRSLWSLPAGNVITQPMNRGTAAGLLLPLLHIAQRDPAATILVLPSDHFVRDEATLARALQRLVRAAGRDRDHVYLLGLQPEEVDPELGYVVPAARCAGPAAPVQRFVEKPSADAARGLIEAGALLNMFIIAAAAPALVQLFAQRHPGLVAQMQETVRLAGDVTQYGPAAQRLYEDLPTLDFSRNILEGQEARLRVVKASACGWSDLGTPRRVAETLVRIGSRQVPSDATGADACLNLAEQYSRQQAHAHFRAYA